MGGRRKRGARSLAAGALIAGIIGAPGPWAAAAFTQRVDVGATIGYTDLAGNPWAADQVYTSGSFGFVSGSSLSSTAAIASTSDDTLYRTMRQAGSLEYRFDVPAATYAVTLRFAEIQPNSFAAGRRVFNISIEGAAVQTGLDVFATVGSNAALDRTFAVSVSDGTLNIVLSRVVGRAMVSAIAVESNETPDFTFSATSSSATTAPAGTATFTVQVAFINEFTSTDTDLWVAGLPAGFSGIYAPDPLSHQGMSVLTLIGNGTTPSGSYPLTLGATAEGITHSVLATLNVNSLPDFGLSISPQSQGLAAGGPQSYGITVTQLNGFTQRIAMSVVGLPLGATGVFSPSRFRPPGVSMLTINSSPTVAEGIYPLIVTGRGGQVSHTITATLIVSGAGSVWAVGIAGSTGISNNSLIMGPGRGDGIDRIYAGTVNTGRVMEFSWNGTSWGSPVDVGGSPSGLEIHNLGMGPGRNDGFTRIYACSLDENLYELTYVGPGWTQATVGAPSGVCTHAVVGDGRNDGVDRLYATRGEIVWEYTWDGSDWTAVEVGSVSDGIVHGIVLGAGRGGTDNHLYVASSATGTYEATFSDGSWSMSSMGDSGDVRNVSFGPGRNDGVSRVYAGISTGVIREFTWIGTSWTIATIATGTRDVMVHAYVLDGRNDGVMRVYGSNGDGNAYEFTWDGVGWTALDMGGGSAYMYGAAPGSRPGETANRFYGAAFDGNVYEFTWGG